MSEARIDACAKLNLYLHLSDLPVDGFHEIDSWMVAISLHDSLLIRETGHELRLECDDPGIPTDNTNLVMRTVILLHQQFHTPTNLHIRLTKRIPVAAGLGGGSSDAAATLRALDALWMLGLSNRVLCQLAARLGSDVPFFLFAPSARARGRGECLEAVSGILPGCFVVVDPGIPVSTKQAYADWDKHRLTAGDPPLKIAPDCVPPAMEVCTRATRNDLEGVLFRRYPRLKRIRLLLAELGASPARVTGSGSAMFGYFIQKKEAVRCRDHLLSLGLRTLLATPLAELPEPELR